MGRISLVIAFVSLCTAAACSRTRELSKQHVYLSAGYARAFENFDVRDADGGQATVDDSYGGLVRMGWRFHPYFSTEFDVEYLTDFDIESDTGDRAGSVSTMLYTVNLKGYLSTQRLQPYGLLAAGIMDVNGSGSVKLEGQSHDSDVVFKYGVGLDVSLSDRFGVFGELLWTDPMGEISDLAFSQFAAGILYRF
ncbi:MAG: outer membrane beta-barrel protein [Planctomycetota bacterium]